VPETFFSCLFAAAVIDFGDHSKGTAMPETTNSVWTGEYEVHSYEVGAGGAATIPVICRFLQESAWHHARSVKQWYDDLVDLGCFWVLSRLTLRMERYPLWGEKIVVKTWGSGIDRLFALRDFIVRDEKGAVIGSARSAWLVVNEKTRKPRRIEPLFTGSPVLADLRAFEDLPEKLPALGNPVKGRSFPVRYSDLDIQNHVNNSQYAEWCLDSFPPPLHATHHPSVFSVNFLAECAYGDVVTLQTEPARGSLPEEPAYLVAVLKEPDEKEICRARILWRKRGEGS
jgi:medium-chain acyl-[acyl-carrier-protein] hydrolase